MPDAPATPGVSRPLSALDVVMFLCELIAVAALALWGFLSWPSPWNVVVGIVAPLAAILVWALFVSPRAVLAVHPFVRAVVELVVFAGATFALWALGLTWIGLAFGVVAVAVGLVVGRRRLS